MLTSIKLVNFQVHRRFEIELDPAVTVLTGRSDVGKSSIVRALLWLCGNRPGGAAFVRWGAAGTRVELRVDGHRVVRRRGKGGNTYSLDGKVYRAFGNSVPDEVAALLNMDGVSWARQFDPPFWLGLSPGEVSKELNKIIALDLIDSTLANLAREERKAKLVVELTEGRLKDAQGKESQLAWVEECQGDLEKIAALEEALAKKTSVKEALTGAIIEGEGLENASRKAGKIAGKLAQDLEKLEGRARCVREQERRVQALRTLVREVERGEGGLCVTRQELKTLGAEFEARLGDRCPLCRRPRR